VSSVQVIQTVTAAKCDSYMAFDILCMVYCYYTRIFC
jgi:hypothetical protein